MSNKVDLTNASVTILIDIDGVTHLVYMDKEKYEAATFIAKSAVEKIYKTEVTTNDLRKFLGVDK